MVYMYMYIIHVYTMFSLSMVSSCLSFQAKEYPTLKDNDFLCTGEKIVIGENRATFIKTLSDDVQVHTVCNAIYELPCIYTYINAR